MIKKTETAKANFLNGDLKGALKIFKTFKIGYSQDERRIMEIAYEYLSGNKAFYDSLGYNENEFIENAKQIIKSKNQLQGA